MSTDDGGSRRGVGERGFTAIEVAVVTVLLGGAFLAIGRTVAALDEAEGLMRAIRSTAGDGPRACQALRAMVNPSRKLFGADAVGQGYLGVLDLGSVPRLPGARLPVFDEAGQLGRDGPGAPRTGNVLLFARACDPAPCVANAATRKIREIDVYRLVCVYLTTSSRTLVQGQPPALDLAVWRSARYPDHAQVMQIADATERRSVVADLHDRFGHALVWDPSRPVSGAFYGIDGSGNVGATPVAVTSLPAEPGGGAGPQLVARNLAVARTDPTSPPRKSVFTVDAPAAWEPHGFEVKVVGPSGSRKVWMRLSVEAQARPGSVPAILSTAVAATRDL